MSDSDNSSQVDKETLQRNIRAWEKSNFRNERLQPEDTSINEVSENRYEYDGPLIMGCVTELFNKSEGRMTPVIENEFRSIVMRAREPHVKKLGTMKQFSIIESADKPAIRNLRFRGNDVKGKKT